MAELLSESGYVTGGFHTNTYLSPTYNYDRGFDYYLGRDTGGISDTESAVSARFSTMVERAVTMRGLSRAIFWAYKNAGKKLGVQLGSNLYKPASELNDAVIDWVKQCSRPVFAWVHYMDVHNPYYPHEGTVSENISRRKAVKLFHKVNDLRSDADDEDIATLERLYRGEIEYFDRELGDLLDRLDRTLGLDNTLVVFTSDHGEAFNEHEYVFHPGSALYEENVHIPLLVRGTDIEPIEVSTPVTNADIVPTILRAAGVKPPASTVGIDLSSIEEQSGERVVFVESYDKTDGGVMATDGRYKLIRDLETGEESLYDRRREETEVTLHTQEYNNVYTTLRSELDEHLRTVTQRESNDSNVEVTEDVRLRLRKLGYDE